MTSAAIAQHIAAPRAFVASRNVVDLSALLAIHAFLATVVLLPGTPLDALRSAVALFYLLLVPGLLMVSLFRLYPEDPLARLVTAVGLSLIYIMVLGLVLSGIPESVIAHPLSAKVFVSVSLAITAALSLVVVSGRRGVFAPFAPVAKLRHLWWSLLPLAAVLVALHVQSGGSNSWMALFLGFLAASPLLVLLRRPTAGECVMALFSIALALAFHKLFITPALNGWDIRVEYVDASLVLDAGRWSPVPNLYGAMLSVTVLPGITSLISGIGLLVTFKLLFGTVLALVPATLFLAFRGSLGIRWALVVALLYLGHVVFSHDMLALGRQVVATFEVALLILTVMSVAPRHSSGRALQIVLALAIIISHYSMFPIMVIAFGFSLLVRHLVQRRITLEPPRVPALPDLLLLLAVVMFAYFWFVWASNEKLFSTFVYVGNNIVEAIRATVLFNRQAVGVATGVIPSGVSYSMVLWANWAILVASVAGLIVFLYSLKRRDGSRILLGTVSIGGIMLVGVFSVAPGTSESLNVSRALFFTLPWLLPLGAYGAQHWIMALRPTPRLRQALLLSAALGLSVYLGLGTGLAAQFAGDKPLGYALKDTRLLALNNYDQTAASFISTTRAGDAPAYTDSLGYTLFLGIDSQNAIEISSRVMALDQSKPFYLYLRKANLEGHWSGRAIFHRTPGAEETKPEDLMRFVETVALRMDLVYQNGGANHYYALEGEASAQGNFEAGN